ncbi:MAG: type II CAAX endopeptidase family protein [Leucobacter sp.]
MAHSDAGEPAAGEIEARVREARDHLAQNRPGGHDATGHDATGHDATGHDATGHDATAEHAVEGSRPDQFAPVPWGAVTLFVFVAFGLAWLVALPLWLAGPADTNDPAAGTHFTLLATAMMFTPAIATLAAIFIVRAPRRERLRFLGIWPLRPAKRVIWFIVAAILAPLVLVLASLAVAALLGWVQLDLTEFSGFRAVLDAQLATLDPATAELAAQTMPPLGLLVAIQIATVPVAALANSLPAFGEEVGWRGWLLPALRPLGVWPALVLSGALWGLWHAPLILLGYNFNRTDWTGVALMTVGCVFWGVLLGWTRLRTASVWPAVVAHGSLNASAGLMLLLHAMDSPLDMALVSPLGVAGWIVLAVVVAVLALTGQFRREPQLAPKPVSRYAVLDQSVLDQSVPDHGVDHVAGRDDDADANPPGSGSSER